MTASSRILFISGSVSAPTRTRTSPSVSRKLAWSSLCGPRIDPATIEAPPGVEVRGYVPRLYEHFAACDVAVVQGGGTTTLELTALRRPFLYFPLEGHFEQTVAVAGRLERHGAGERHEFSTTTAQALADAVVRQLERRPTWPSIPSDGARRAAELILARLEHPSA